MTPSHRNAEPMIGRGARVVPGPLPHHLACGSALGDSRKRSAGPASPTTHGRSIIPATAPSRDGDRIAFSLVRGWHRANDVDRKAVVRPLHPAAPRVYPVD